MVCPVGTWTLVTPAPGTGHAMPPALIAVIVAPVTPTVQLRQNGLRSATVVSGTVGGVSRPRPWWVAMISQLAPPVMTSTVPSPLLSLTPM
jgi:hypothetical protein